MRHGYRGRQAWITGWLWNYGFTVIVWGTWGLTIGLPKIKDNSYTHVDKHDWRLSCSCKQWSDKANNEAQATNLGMAHILKHDAELEDYMEGIVG